MARNYVKLTDLFENDGGSCRQRRPVCFNQNHHRNGVIKTIQLQKIWKEGPDEVEYFQLKYPQQAEMSPSCPLFRKLDSKRFLHLLFYKACPEKIVKLLVENGLRVKIGSSRETLYKFFGHSPTLLRSKECILYDTSYDSYDNIIHSFGVFPLGNVAKRAARIGLLLSESQVTVSLENQEICSVEDITTDKYNFTDGCGFISLEVAIKVTDKLASTSGKYGHQELQVPSVFQVRIKGCKGVLMLTTDPRYSNRIAIRPSMEKFKWDLPPPHPLGICSGGTAVSSPNRYSSLNKQVIRLLSGLGVPDEVFFEKQEKFFKDLMSIERDQNIQVQYLCAFEHFYEAESLLHGNSSSSEDENVSQALRKIRSNFIFIPRKGKHKNFSSMERDDRAKKKKVPTATLR